MPSLTLAISGPADRLLLAGLVRLRPVLDELAGGALVIGGFAVTAWLQTHPVGLPVRATRDIDLGIDRGALGLTSRSRRIQPLLERHDFGRRPGDEPFRFTCETEAGVFLLDLLLPKGASRENPPVIEAGLDSVAAPGLAYALYRGAEQLQLTLDAEGRRASFDLPVATLDAMLVMKALLVSEGARHQLDRLVTDTADAAMLAAAVARSPEAVDAIRGNRGRREVRRAIRWLDDAFTDERSAAARRVQRHFEQEYERADGSAWAVEHVAGFLDVIDGRGRL